jgi:hypothetical protein
MICRGDASTVPNQKAEGLEKAREWSGGGTAEQVGKSV